MFNLFSERFIISLCWTLIHSLWQGFILAVIAAVFIQSAKRAKPQTRYLVLLSLFSVQLILSAVTFFVTLGVAQPPVDISGGNITTGGFTLVTQVFGSGIEDTSVFAKVEVFLNDHASLIVNSWFLIMTLLFIRMLAGLIYLKKLRSVKTVQPDSYWEQCIEKIAQSANLQRPVQLLESKLVKAPMIIGYLKPLILLPIGLLNDYNLSQSQIEAILCHEIAHIKRHDYLVNIFQTIAELIFFFNPFVWWMSSLLRDEREYCCDAEVVNGFSDKRTMVEALVSFQESKIRTERLAMGFGGSAKHKLLQRAKRIFYEKNDGISLRTKTVLAGCLIVFFVGVMTMYGQSQQHQDPKTGVFSSQPRKVVDTIPAKDSLREEERVRQAEEEVRQREDTIRRLEEIVRQKEGKSDEENGKGEDIIEKIKNDLIANKIITNRVKVSFKLGYDEFIVNGVVQPPAIRKLFFDKYDGDVHTIYYCNWVN